MAPTERFDTLVMAGRRSADDPLADATGAAHRALLDIQGQPMLERVVETLRRCERIGRITVSIDAPELLSDLPRMSRWIADDVVRVVKSESSPSRSVLAALTGHESGGVLVTTADHALLDERMLDHFLGESAESEATVSVALVAATAIRERFPEAKRTYLKFRGESYSGANLFAFRLPEGLAAVEFWKRAEGFRKQPWRMIGTLGLGTLILFALGRLDLQQAFARASAAIGAEVRPVEMPFAEAAVDVDKLSDLELVNEILSKRGAAAS